VRSCVGAEPVTVGLVCLEHLLTELLVTTALNSVELETVGVRVHVMVFGEQVRDGVEGSNYTEHQGDDDLLIGGLVTAKVRDVLRNIMGHLRSGRGGAVVVLDHAVMELRGHGDDHVIVVRVEVTTLGHIKTERRRVMVASQQVVWIVDKTGLMGTSFGQIGRPHTHVGVLRLMDSHIGRPDSVMDLPLSEVPLLEEVTSVLLMSRMNLREVLHGLLEFHLGETLADEKIVFFVHGAVATLARSGEDLETASQRC